MMFWRDGWLVRVQRATSVAAVAVLLASCGGGEQVKKFLPGRVIAFGDETSVLDDTATPHNADKYTVNFVSDATATPPNTKDCTQNPTWAQTVANAYGVPFPECNGATPLANAPSLMRAAPNARVADVSAQVDAFVAANGFRPDDLVTIYAGAHDIWDVYQATLTGGLSSDQAVARAEQAGTSLANIVNRVAQAGAKILIATVPNQNLTPDGRADTTGRLLQLSQRFNAKLRTGLFNDGRVIGLVLFDETVTSIVNSGIYETVDKACNDATVADLRTCTTQTLRTITDANGAPLTATTATWLWADGTHLAPLGQSSLGSLAFTRATNNPF